jgi:hypothetical protein
MLLNFFDDVLRLDLALETAKGILQRLSLLKPDFSHSTDTPQLFKVLFFLYNWQKLMNFCANVKNESETFRLPSQFKIAQRRSKNRL